MYGFCSATCSLCVFELFSFTVSPRSCPDPHLSWIVLVGRVMGQKEQKRDRLRADVPTAHQCTEPCDDQAVFSDGNDNYIQESRRLGS